MNVSLRAHFEYLLGTYGPSVAGPVMPSLMWKGPAGGGEKVAYLTFDDGPTAHSTSALIDILDGFHAAATFFLLGRQIDMYPDRARELVRRGHSVGVHGYSHLDSWRTEHRIVEEDLRRAVSTIEETIERKVRYYRPPYGRFTRSSLRLVSRLGLEVVMWGIMPGDYLVGIDRDKIVARVMGRLVPGSIVVLHDSGNSNVRMHTAAAVRCILERGTELGWRFAALPDALPDGLADALPDRLADALPDGLADALPDGLANALPET